MPSKKRGRRSSSEDEGSQIQEETRLEPYELDHSETFWDVKCILNESLVLFRRPGWRRSGYWKAMAAFMGRQIRLHNREWKAVKRKKKVEAKAAKSAKGSTYTLHISKGVRVALCSVT